jgi:hypothetical protein
MQRAVFKSVMSRRLAGSIGAPKPNKSALIDALRSVLLTKESELTKLTVVVAALEAAAGIRHLLLLAPLSPPPSEPNDRRPSWATAFSYQVVGGYLLPRDTADVRWRRVFGKGEQRI